MGDVVGPASAGRDATPLERAFAAFAEGACSRDAVRAAVRAEVEQARAAGRSPEQVLITLKRAMQGELSRRQAVRPREELEALAWRLAGWCVDAYFEQVGAAPGSSPVPPEEARATDAARGRADGRPAD